MALNEAVTVLAQAGEIDQALAILNGIDVEGNKVNAFATIEIEAC
jgi:hypothetical protein